MRRIRGVVVIAVLWGLAWAPIGLIAGIREYRARTVTDLIGFPRLGEETDFSSVLIYSTLAWVLVGTLAGACFAAIISVVEGRRPFHTLSWRRFAVFGILSVVMLMVVALVGLMINIRDDEWFVNLGQLIGFLTLGAVSAAATLALARRSGHQS